jgi:hypothetical protein
MELGGQPQPRTLYHQENDPPLPMELVVGSVPEPFWLFGCFVYCVIMHAVSDSIISSLPAMYKPCYRKTGSEKNHDLILDPRSMDVGQSTSFKKYFRAGNDF